MKTTTHWKAKGRWYISDVVSRMFAGRGVLCTVITHRHMLSDVSNGVRNPEAEQARFGTGITTIHSRSKHIHDAQRKRLGASV